MAKHAETQVNLFSMSFLDCICCGFGAVILLFVIINARTAAHPGERDQGSARRGRAGSSSRCSRASATSCSFATPSTTRSTSSRSPRAAAGASSTRSARRGGARRRYENDDRRDARARQQAQGRRASRSTRRSSGSRRRSRPTSEGEKLREFKGAGDRHYLTGLRVGGRRLLDPRRLLGEHARRPASSTSCAAATCPTTASRAAEKWQQAVRTVDWLSTQIPVTSQFQIYGFNETAFPLVAGTDGDVARRKQPGPSRQRRRRAEGAPSRGRHEPAQRVSP